MRLPPTKGKTGKAIKRRKLASFTETEPDSSSTSNASDSSYLSGLVSPSEVLTTTRTLSTLSHHPDLLKSSQLKSLRGAVFDFHRTTSSLLNTGTTLSSRISAALTTSRHTDALVLLSEARIRKFEPKLGSLQRWVRDCDAASRSDGSFGDERVLEVLDAILRIQDGLGDGRVWPEPVEGTGGVRKDKEWKFREGSGKEIWKEVKEGTLIDQGELPKILESFILLHSTPGPLRLPPNHHPALLYTNSSTSHPLLSAPVIPVQKIPVPTVPKSFLLTDVLSLEECRKIITAAEAVGFKPDQPITVEDGASILAHNLYWFADKEFMESFWKRVGEFMPQECNGGKVMGLNPRFRVYRYVPGAIYRPHIDGAWPKSGLHPTTGEYLYDSSPSTEPQWSRLTFLLYLNDDFPTGHTTFFLPSSTPGVLNAYPIKPIAGCALVFPHGDTKGSLLHEGSPVGEGGAKYVIRTEVLYRVRGSGEEGGLEV